MSELVMRRPGVEVEAAWLWPVAAPPLALALVWGATGILPDELWDAISPMWATALGLAALASTAYSARILSASAKENGPPPSLAIVPFVVPQLVGLLGANHWLSETFVARTYCGPATREQVITWSLSSSLMMRLLPLFFAAAGVFLVALASVFISRRMAGRVRWATVAAVSVLALSLLVQALSVAFIRRHLLEFLESTFDPTDPWLSRVILEYRDYTSAANTLLLAALVFAAAAMSRSHDRRTLSGLVTLVAVVSCAVGIRAIVLVDEAQYRRRFDEFPIFRGVRPWNAENWSVDGVHLYGRLDAAKDVRSHLEFAGDWTHHWTLRKRFEAARAKGVPVPWPVALSVSAESPVSTLEFQRALATLRGEGVSDVVFHSPVEPMTGPNALRPLIEIRNSYDRSDAISARFDDEEICETTSGSNRELVKTAKGLVSAWTLPCETISLGEVTSDNLHALAGAALSRGNRLVVLVPRKFP